MNRALISPRYFVIALLLVVGMGFWIGLWSWHKRNYACLGDDGFHFQSKVQIFQWGSVHVFTFPIEQSCPEIERVPVGTKIQ